MSLSFALYLVLLAVVFAIGLLRFRQRTTPFKALTLLVGVTFVSEVLTRLLIEMTKNSSPVYHVYVIVLYFFYAWIYRELSSDPRLKKAIVVSAAVFLLLSITNSIFYQPLRQFPSNMLMIACVLLVMLSLMMYRQMFNYPIEQNLFRQPVFWLNTGTLFFFTTTFLFWSFFNYFIRQKLDTTLLINMVYVSNILYYMTLGVSLLV
jgi:hypothetical protein